jgi:mRNA interferase HigB
MPAINAWYKIARSKDIWWQKPQDVVKTFGVSRVDILQGNRVCINLAGNHVRLILKVEYGLGMAFVRWIGWHKDYDALGNNIHKI